MHLQRSGPAPAGALQPTLVIEAGGGCASSTYGRLQQVLSAKYPVISYDRAGMGWSEADPEPFDGQRNAQRLHALLEAAGVTGPVVLIGHSMGGLLNRIYTGLYPERVVGLVMLDASHPDQCELFRQPLPQAHLDAERAKRSAFQAGGAAPPEMAPFEAMFADLPDVVRQLKATYTPEAIDTMVSEHAGLPRVTQQAAASPDLGARPVAVLWAAQDKLPAGTDSASEVQRRWPEYQQDHAALSTRGRVQLVEGAAHMTLVLLPPFVQQIAQAVDLMMAELGWSQ
ncbi:alpha/beta hydrolase [Variovorax sp. H27-G14]|uniref:alpha/beta fold hydrolase n=1 Tax=Variovorax sp. H27-G14 TaxID=3111914 RepID=UPI0038FC9BC6